MKRFWKIIWPFLKNKYVLALAGFIVWISFFSQYSLMDQVQLSRNLKQLRQEKVYYIDQIKRDSTRLHELTTDNENLEKFAREQYYMKKANEDVFVVVEESAK
ncbi:septum formation initiator family protein [Bacteroidota bacterium]